MEYVDLNDLGFRGSPFTWYRGGIFERLDRAIENDSWVESFPNCSITHFSILKSDHKPLLMSLRPSLQSLRRCPFWFLAGWVEHPKFSDFVKDK